MLKCTSNNLFVMLDCLGFFYPSTWENFFLSMEQRVEAILNNVEPIYRKGT